MSDAPPPPPTSPAGPEGPPRRRSSLPWQVIVAATVLALTAAGLVLVVAARDGDDGAAAADRTTDTLTLRPVDDVPTGDPLDIEFTDVDGTTGTLRGLVGEQPMVVNFFASWCPPCVGEMPDFEAVSQELGDDVRFVGLAVTDRPEDASRIVDQTGITYKWSRDVRGDIAGAVGITSMPSTLFISTDGEIVDIQAGAVDADQLRSLIAKHLSVSS